MITVLHLTTAAAPEERFRLQFPVGEDEPGETPVAVARRLLATPGRYEVVARAEGGVDRLDAVWSATQNLDDSWSRSPPPGIVPAGDGIKRASGGEFGQRSSDIGDVFVVDGTSFHAVATLGFVHLGDGLPCDALAGNGGTA